MNKKLLYINPHPDDEAFYLGGTLSYYSKRNVDIHVLTLSRGEKGTVTDPELKSIFDNTDDKESYISKIRTLEINNSLDVLNVPVKNRYYGNLPNLGVDLNAVRIISGLLIKIDPHVVISLNEAGTSRFTNQDHSWSAIATYYSVLANINKLNQFKKYFTHTVSGIENYFDDYNELNLNPKLLTNIDVRDEIKYKIDAVHKHKSQKHLIDYFSKIGFLNIKNESFLERINLCEISSVGTDDLFYGINLADNKQVFSYEKHIKFPMPLHKRDYKSSGDYDIYNEIKLRCLKTNKFII